MKISILTLFPEMFAPLQHSILARASEKGLLEIELINIRDFSASKHKNTDDYPFGGGDGMLMSAQPIFDAMRSIEGRPHRIYLSPKGRVLTNAKARALAQHEHIALLCGHYEGVDQRVIDTWIDEEISVGDYILTGGELPAMIVTDAVSRYVCGVLGDGASAHEDSFSDGLLEAPQYTRPAEFEGLCVPPVLLSGNHAQIQAWKREQQLRTTLKMRPELLESAELSDRDQELLRKIREEEEPKET